MTLPRERPLGRRPSDRGRSIERYPLSALRTAPPTRVPVVLGVNWYSNFDAPQRSGGAWWIGRGNLGSVRGGHAICLKPWGVQDRATWWDFYDQGIEGACVGFACARMMTLLNRRRYNARWLYQRAQEIDEWDDTPPAEGTSVRAACEILRVAGLPRPDNDDPAAVSGVAEYRWTDSWDEVRAALGQPEDRAGVPILNSWGQDYPHFTRITDEAGARLLAEGGEAAIVTDRAAPG